MRARTTILTLCFAALTLTASAQSVTYNHDDAKMNQITVMEIGSGTLTPELYYWALHNSYQKSAASKNKLTYRSLAGASAYSQIDDAEAIDSALTERAEIEALNVADRELDIAWLAEGSKIETQLARFQQNINRILGVGGTLSDKERWQEYYYIYSCAISSTQDAYMPNARRKEQYLSIYADITRQNEILVKYLVQLYTSSQTSSLLSATNERTLDKGSIAREAQSRWKAVSAAFGSSSSDSSDTDDTSGETVSR